MLKRLILILLTCATVTHAQDRLTMEDAITRALAHNFDISIARNQAQQAAVNNTIGNAGMLPNIYGQGVYGGSSYNTRSELAAGGEQTRNNAKATALTASANLNWTLFDGGRMFLVKHQLDVLEKQGDLNLKAQVQSTVAQVIQAYAQVVYLHQQSMAIDTGLALAKVRMQLSLAKYETGTAPKTDYLQARVDYNARQSDSLTQRVALNNSFGTLNVLMGEDAELSWIVDDTLISNTTLAPAEKELLKDINYGMRAARADVEAAKLNVGIQKSYMLPTLGVNGAYNYSRSTSQTGFALFTRSYGPTGSINLTVPLFQGGILKTRSKVATLQALQSELIYEKQSTEFGRQYRSAWNNYQVALYAYKLEAENIQFAKENLMIQQARFRVGVATTLEARQAENDYVTALVRLYTTAFGLKQTETNVLLLENGLVKQAE